MIAIAGGAEKCKWLKEVIGVDAALDYKSAGFKKEFKEVVGYLDVYFDNVGGEILDLCLTRLNKYARIARKSKITFLSFKTYTDAHCVSAS